ncbi:alpha-amylase family glycosyl hydrolase, partial [Caldilinea sp.]|uniref:alpha-amylase family glycosyl hydrolase n=1 Tax=Caldilinea sp. TaxID=2293560 RepID=UPI002BF503DD|nr:alpha-amylase family glycosyl hydrolase [Caldilinea sp.]
MTKLRLESFDLKIALTQSRRDAEARREKRFLSFIGAPEGDGRRPLERESHHMSFQTPDWVKDAVFYQIYPDRFARSQSALHSPGLNFKPWGSPPEEQGFQGGDLLGIVERLDYLQDLGVNALYL